MAPCGVRRSFSPHKNSPPAHRLPYATRVCSRDVSPSRVSDKLLSRSPPLSFPGVSLTMTIFSPVTILTCFSMRLLSFGRSISVPFFPKTLSFSPFPIPFQVPVDDALTKTERPSPSTPSFSDELATSRPPSNSLSSFPVEQSSPLCNLRRKLPKTSSNARLLTPCRPRFRPSFQDNSYLNWTIPNVFLRPCALQGATSGSTNMEGAAPVHLLSPNLSPPLSHIFMLFRDLYLSPFGLAPLFSPRFFPLPWSRLSHRPLPGLGRSELYYLGGTRGAPKEGFSVRTAAFFFSCCWFSFFTTLPPLLLHFPPQAKFFAGWQTWPAFLFPY